MGMFDYIRVEVELPGGESFPCRDPNVDGDEPVLDSKMFQTKCLDNALRTYCITLNGELYSDEWDYEAVERDVDETHIFYGLPILQKIEGSYHREYLTDFHGDIIFYGGLRPDNIWRDYHARFTDGKLTKLWYTDHTY
jgi:hypothetical protein